MVKEMMRYVDQEHSRRVKFMMDTEFNDYRFELLRRLGIDPSWQQVDKDTYYSNPDLKEVGAGALLNEIRIASSGSSSVG